MGLTAIFGSRIYPVSFSSAGIDARAEKLSVKSDINRKVFGNTMDMFGNGYCAEGHILDH